MRFSTVTAIIHVRSRASGKTWEVWCEREAACELLGSATATDVRAAYRRLIQALADQRPGPLQRWLMDTARGLRQLVVELDRPTPELLLLDAEASSLPVLLRWPMGAGPRPRSGGDKRRVTDAT